MREARWSARRVEAQNNTARGVRVATGAPQAASGESREPRESLKCSLRRDPTDFQAATWRGDFLCAMILRPPARDNPPP